MQECPTLLNKTPDTGEIPHNRTIKTQAEMEEEAVNEVQTMEERKKDRVQELMNASRTLGTTENVIYNQHAQRVEQERLNALAKRQTFMCPDRTGT